MKRFFVFITVLILIVASVITFFSLSGNDTEKQAPNDDDIIVTQKDLGFEQWIPVRFFDNENPLSEVAVSAPNKCLIIRKGCLQVNDASSQKFMYLKDCFGNLFSINYGVVNIDAVSELTGAYIPDGGKSMSKTEYNQIWALSETPYDCSSPDTKVRKTIPSPSRIFLHLTLSQIDDLYQQ